MHAELDVGCLKYVVYEITPGSSEEVKRLVWYFDSESCARGLIDYIMQNDPGWHCLEIEREKVR